MRTLVGALLQRGPLPGRLAMLGVLAGVLLSIFAMHGLGVVANDGAHASVTGSVAAAGGPMLHEAPAPGTPAPGTPAPGGQHEGHSGLLVGCVVALAGLAGALLWSLLRRSATVGWSPTAPRRPVLFLRLPAPLVLTGRTYLSLCVLRV